MHTKLQERNDHVVETIETPPISEQLDFVLRQRIQTANLLPQAYTLQNASLPPLRPQHRATLGPVCAQVYGNMGVNTSSLVSSPSVSPQVNAMVIAGITSPGIQDLL